MFKSPITFNNQRKKDKGDDSAVPYLEPRNTAGEGNNKSNMPV